MKTVILNLKLTMILCLVSPLMSCSQAVVQPVDTMALDFTVESRRDWKLTEADKKRIHEIDNLLVCVQLDWRTIRCHRNEVFRKKHGY